LPNQFGIVPTDAQAFDGVAEEVARIGNDFIRKNKDEQIIIAQTISPKHTFDAIRAEASTLMERIGATVRWAGPIIVTGEAEPGETPDIRDILLLTDVVIVKVRKDVQPDAVLAIAERIGLRLFYRHPADGLKYYFESPPEREDVNVITASQALLEENSIVDYAVPDTIVFIELRSSSLNDEFFYYQWPLDNTGQDGGMGDADIDADLAWSKFGLGNSGTIIAVLDDGFDMTHLDLAPNIFVNVDEAFGQSGVDDDGNHYLDDRNGWDVTSGCGPNDPPDPYCGDGNPTASGAPDGRHGTMTSGAAAARGNNIRGVSGSCPHCTLLPVRIGLWPPTRAQALAFDYARAAGAHVITNSWGYKLQGIFAQDVIDAIDRAYEAGSAIFFAMSRTGLGYQNDCANNDISSLKNVIAVSASNNVDTRTPAGYGDCMEVLAPTDNDGANAGTLWPVSTDFTGALGYNDNYRIPGCASPDLGPPPPDHLLSYTRCANGTSYATPLAAGIAGLMVSVDPGLTPERVRQVLQDTADKIEPAVAAYDPNTGFSSPSAAPLGSSGGSTHGFGRVNAFEAVRLVAPAAGGGRGEVDLFLRDNRIDWGNTEQPSTVLVPKYKSVSIKIDAPPYEPGPPPKTPQAFADLPDEEPRAEVTNKIYVLVRNRGRNDATNVTVNLAVGKPLDPLPPDFWGAQVSAGSTITTSWALVDTKMIPSVGYSGASIALKPGDGAQIATFDFDAPSLAPSLPGFRDYSLLAVVDAPDDPVSDDSRASFAPDQITPTDNNVTLRNVSMQDPPSF
jgi:hypothetical protein